MIFATDAAGRKETEHRFESRWLGCALVLRTMDVKTHLVRHQKFVILRTNKSTITSLGTHETVSLGWYAYLNSFRKLGRA